MITITARVHTDVAHVVAEWLEDAATDAADSRTYPNPHLAEAFRRLADSARRTRPGSHNRGEAPTETRTQ